MIAQVAIGRRRNLRRVNEWVREQDMTPSVNADERPPAFGNPWHKVRDSLSNRNVRLALAVAFLFLWAELGVIAFLTLQLTREVGLSPAQAVVISGASGLTGWIGQIVWGTLSDGLGRKFSLNIIAIGWTISVLAMIFISSAATAWIILIGWGLFRNSPFPVLYALILDSVPESASSGMGLTIGIALGLSGLIVSTVAGFFVQNFGFTWDYIMLASACLLALIPIAMLRETVDIGVTAAGGE